MGELQITYSVNKSWVDKMNTSQVYLLLESILRYLENHILDVTGTFSLIALSRAAYSWPFLTKMTFLHYISTFYSIL